MWSKLRQQAATSIGRKYDSHVRLVAVVASVALSLPAAAAASSWPPPPAQTLHLLKLERAHAQQEARSCMARAERAKVARWLEPVACEQPPRSQLLLASLYGG